VHGHGGRFLTVLPRTRSEDRRFREALAGGRARGDAFTISTTRRATSSIATAVSEPAATSAEGYRLVWYHSARKAGLDALAPRAATGADLGGTWRSSSRS